MKFKTLEQIQKFLEEEYVVEGSLSERDKKTISLFVKAYPEEVLLDLNKNQLLLLIYMCYIHSTDSDHGSFGMGWSRRAFVNTANSLNRRGLCWWDVPCYSDEREFCLDRDKLLSEDILGC